MYGKPQESPEEGGVVINPVWTYTRKCCGRYKVRQTCDGYGLKVKGLSKVVKHSKCLDGEGTRLTVGMAAVKGWCMIQSDCTNAFAQSEGPTTSTFERLDKAMRDYYKHEKNIDVPEGWVVPVLK